MNNPVVITMGFFLSWFCKPSYIHSQCESINEDGAWKDK